MMKNCPHSHTRDTLYKLMSSLFKKNCEMSPLSSPTPLVPHTCFIESDRHWFRLCLMANDKWIWLELATGFEVIYYVATGAHCVGWAAHNEYQESLAYTLPSQVWVITVGCYVQPDNMIPGVFYIHDNGLQGIGNYGLPWYTITLAILPTPHAVLPLFATRFGAFGSLS